jgi:hypothetical protein
MHMNISMCVNIRYKECQMKEINKKRPVQIRDGVILDPNVKNKNSLMRVSEGVFLENGDRPAGHVRPPDPCPSYAKIKTKQQDWS